LKKRDLGRHLAEHGCMLVRQAANPELWENQATGQRTSVPRHREIKTPAAWGICRQLGVPLPRADERSALMQTVSRILSRTQQF